MSRRRLVHKDLSAACCCFNFSSGAGEVYLRLVAQRPHRIYDDVKSTDILAMHWQLQSGYDEAYILQLIQGARLNYYWPSQIAYATVSVSNYT
eukprot:scaffold38148_cov35-Prasinocladus_malaysianus.AAC.2